MALMRHPEISLTGLTGVDFDNMTADVEEAVLQGRAVRYPAAAASETNQVVDQQGSQQDGELLLTNEPPNNPPSRRRPKKWYKGKLAKRVEIGFPRSENQ